jgi:uncharacterized protein (TIGR04551 family)
MTRSPLVAGFGLAIVLTFVPGVSRAQVGPSPMPGGGAGSGEEDKPDGVAEEAPKTPGLLPTTPTLPPPKGKRNRFELFELDGYFRLRGDYFKNLNLSFRDDPAFGGAPFPRNLGCATTLRNCNDSVKSTNIRLRLEPKINVNETTSVHMQIDVLDNVVLGATPSGRPGIDIPLGAFEDGQDAPEAGKNWSSDSIKVKRAWGEVQTPLGIIKFGRQASHWGLGIYQNSGGEDPINGGYDYDGDYGDSVDRVSFSTLIPGTKLRGAIAYDWPVNGPSSALTAADRGGQPWDLDDNDDVNQWVLVMSRMDAPADFRDQVDRGELAMNYGVYFAYRKQSWDYTGSPQVDLDDTDMVSDLGAFVPRESTAYIPDAWFRLGYKNITFEAEALTILGNIDAVDDFLDADGNRLDSALKLREFGGVGRLNVSALGGKLKFGAEVGGASGDQYDNPVEGETHVTRGNFVPDVNDSVYSAFQLDRDYKVDLILWRELYGAVTNAVYTKPFLSYELTKTIGFKVANITSFALKPVSTPGNSTMYGTEFDADVSYNSSSFSAGLAYGVFVPLAAMDHPDAAVVGDGFSYGTSGDDDNNVGSAGNAHTVQARLVVKF